MRKYTFNCTTEMAISVLIQILSLISLFNTVTSKQHCSHGSTCFHQLSFSAFTSFIKYIFCMLQMPSVLSLLPPRYRTTWFWCHSTLLIFSSLPAAASLLDANSGLLFTFWLQRPFPMIACVIFFSHYVPLPDSSLMPYPSLQCRWNFLQQNFCCCIFTDFHLCLLPVFPYPSSGNRSYLISMYHVSC